MIVVPPHAGVIAAVGAVVTYVLVRLARHRLDWWWGEDLADVREVLGR